MIDYNVIQQLRNNLIDGEARESREHPGTRELSHPTSTEPLVAGRATLDAREKAHSHSRLYDLLVGGEDAIDK